VIGKKFGRDFSPPPHQFFGRCRDAERLFVKLDCETVTHAKHILVIVAAIGNAVFGQQLRVDLVPPRLGVGKNTIQIKNHRAKRLCHLAMSA